MPDPDLEKRRRSGGGGGGGGGGRPPPFPREGGGGGGRVGAVIQTRIQVGGGGSPQILFSALGASVWSKNKGGGPPGLLP